MASITFALDDELKSKVEKLSWINWSELARQELSKRQEVFKSDERSRLFEELEELTKDSTLSDEDCLKLGKLVKERFKKLE